MQRKGVKTHILLAIIAAALLLGGGLMRDVGDEVSLNGENGIFEDVRDFLSELFSPEVAVRRNLPIEGTIQHNNTFGFTDIISDSVELSYIPNKTNVTADGNEITVDKESANMGLEGFAGYIIIGNSSIELHGNVNSFSSETTTMDGENIEVFTRGKYSTMEIKEVEINELPVEAVSGKVTVDDTVTVQTDGIHISIHSFLGDMRFEEDQLSLDGTVNRVSTENKTISS